MAPLVMQILAREVQLSPAAYAYLQQASEQTRRPLAFEPLSDLAIKVGIRSSFRRDPERLVIEVSTEALLAGERLEYALCHEATHGLLAYRDGFSYAKAKADAPKGTAGRVSLMMTMLDDLVVNLHLAVAGLRAYLPSYIANVKKETAALGQRHATVTQMLGEGYQAPFRVFQYVNAWGCSHLWEASLPDRKVLAKFLKRFAETQPQEHAQARQIIEQLESRDILLADSHLAMIQTVSKLWDLADKIDIEAEAPLIN